jgi:hypothetical protein
VKQENKNNPIQKVGNIEFQKFKFRRYNAGAAMIA